MNTGLILVVWFFSIGLSASLDVQKVWGASVSETPSRVESGKEEEKKEVDSPPKPMIPAPPRIPKPPEGDQDPPVITPPITDPEMAVPPPVMDPEIVVPPESDRPESKETPKEEATESKSP